MVSSLFFFGLVIPLPIEPSTYSNEMMRQVHMREKNWGQIRTLRWWSWGFMKKKLSKPCRISCITIKGLGLAKKFFSAPLSLPGAWRASASHLTKNEPEYAEQGLIIMIIMMVGWDDKGLPSTLCTISSSMICIMSSSHRFFLSLFLPATHNLIKINHLFQWAASWWWLAEWSMNSCKFLTQFINCVCCCLLLLLLLEELWTWAPIIDWLALPIVPYVSLSTLTSSSTETIQRRRRRGDNEAPRLICEKIECWFDHEMWNPPVYRWDLGVPRLSFFCCLLVLLTNASH